MKSFIAIAAFVGLVAAQDLAGEINNLPPCGVSQSASKGRIENWSYIKSVITNTASHYRKSA